MAEQKTRGLQRWIVRCQSLGTGIVLRPIGRFLGKYHKQPMSGQITRNIQKWHCGKHFRLPIHLVEEASHCVLLFACCVRDVWSTRKGLGVVHHDIELLPRGLGSMSPVVVMCSATENPPGAKIASPVAKWRNGDSQDALVAKTLRFLYLTVLPSKTLFSAANADPQGTLALACFIDLFSESCAGTRKNIRESLAQQLIVHPAVPLGLPTVPNAPPLSL